MSNKHSSAFLLAGLLSLLLLAPTQAANINASIIIDADSEADGASTVNGSVTVGRRATVTGSLDTVNGSVKVASGAKTGDISSVNGSIRIEENVAIDGGLSVVNGKIGVAPGSRISDDVSNINGEIQISAAEIHGDLSTVNGDVSLENGAILHGNLIVEKPGGFHRGGPSARRPKIIIGPRSRVAGEIVVKREVELYIGESAEVARVSGVMSLDQAVRFSGKRP